MPTTEYADYAVGDIIEVEFVGRATGEQDADGVPLFYRDRGNPLGGGGGSACCYPAKIIDKDGAAYNVTKFENGIDAPSTGTAKVWVLGLNIADTLPVDFLIIVNVNAIGVTGGGNVP